MKGGAKSRKRLTKKSQNYGYTAPRLKDGTMTEASVYTYDPSKKYMDRSKAAINIQSKYRGKKTRSKYDMNSEWYKGFPSEAPNESLDLELISRITENAIQGIDSRKERDYYDSERRKVEDRYKSEYDKFGKLDELKYNWGNYYSNKDISRRLSVEDKELIRFQKKNLKKLKKISDKKKYFQKQLNKNDISKYDPNRVINTDEFNIRSIASDAYEYPDKVKDHLEVYYKGKYIDEDVDNYKYLPDYKIEEPPELSPINSDDSVEYSEDDELLIPREDIIQATDYYKTRKEAKDKLLDKLTTYTKKYDVLETELDKKLELDIEKCLHAKKMAKADIKLYKDPFFMENYYEPCSDNENLTQIYIDTFYSLPWELIKPVSRAKFGETIDNMIHHIPTIQWKNGLITRDGQYILRDILRRQGLLDDPTSRISHRENNIYYGSRQDRIETLIVLSNFYRWATRGNIKLLHLNSQPKIYSNLPGRSHLQMTFNELDEAFEENPEYFNGNVEKVKRYFILRLIGIIGNPEYPEILQNFIDIRTKVVNNIKINIEDFKKELENNINFIKDIYAGFEYEGHKIDMDKFISEYKSGLLEGLSQENDEKMHYLTGQIDEIKSDISKSEKKLSKFEKDLEIAKRFNRITGTPKDYMTWEPEKLVYE